MLLQEKCISTFFRHLGLYSVYALIFNYFEVLNLQLMLLLTIVNYRVTSSCFKCSLLTLASLRDLTFLRATNNHKNTMRLGAHLKKNECNASIYCVYILRIIKIFSIRTVFGLAQNPPQLVKSVINYTTYYNITGPEYSYCFSRI